MKNLEGQVIVLASDHAGFDRKQVIMKYLSEKGIAYKDMGTYTAESTDYPDFGHLLGDAIDKGDYEIGISLCGSGQGINMTVNKHQSVRAALCWSAEIAALARQHNNANVCSLPARFVTDDEAIKIVETFLNTDFEGGRHERRVNKIPVN